ncbi:Predicted arabinose efflux permease, MFS family [Microbacterium testaceum StLB037]|uniref:Predicted arabinose efflux permease, MFS family n=1 Tax=Microbacterium testaceum (strain StLB037) TaxID=979556 RepID=A0A1H0P8R7_MICTS|nr:MFS transporter [Microbacterium testaceum]SDP01452.1 Predicted arabinose efflux permease, MFS family [Microbacterium testaceum StLB037]
MPEIPTPAGVDLAATQRRTVRVLAAGQVLTGVAFGATLSLGALLAADLSGQEALSGFATASVTLGAALTAIPLARLAGRRGRRVALTTGNMAALLGIAVVVTAAALRAFPLLLVGIALIGAGNAATLQSRFAATDLSTTSRRGRDLATVVWATTVGGVVGPLLLAPGELIGASVGMPPLTGAYLFSFAAQVCAFGLYVLVLRPDPLLLAQRLDRERTASATAPAPEADRPLTARFAMLAVAASHVTMASVMAMTPVHLSHIVAPDAVTLAVGVTIALHVFGMYGLSPLFGGLADRWGRIPVILLGQVLLAASLAVAAAFSDTQGGVLVALVLLGLGWSAATVAGSALLTEATPLALRPRRQGRSDTLMTACAAVGSVLAGVILGLVGYGGLALWAFVPVTLVCAGAVVVGSRRPIPAA